MKWGSFAFLGIGIILFLLGLFLTAGVIIAQIPFLIYVAWIPMGVGGLFIIIGLVLIAIRR